MYWCLEVVEKRRGGELEDVESSESHFPFRFFPSASCWANNRKLRGVFSVRNTRSESFHLKRYRHIISIYHSHKQTSGEIKIKTKLKKKINNEKKREKCNAEITWNLETKQGSASEVTWVLQCHLADTLRQNIALKVVAKMWHLDPKIFHFVSLFICVRCFNPFDDGQYDIDWGGPVTLREGQVTPVS